MKVKTEKKRKIYSFFIILIILSLFLSSIPIVYAGSNISASFDPYTAPDDPPDDDDYTPTYAPIANITCSLKTGYAYETQFFFSGNNSYDPDGSIVSYRWDFENDGLWDIDWSENQYMSHIYNITGNITVKLQVKDDDGLTDIDTCIITITELEADLKMPIANSNGPYWGVINENITFNSTGSYDPDGNITKYTWYFGDRNSSNLTNPTHNYSKSGVFLVTLIVEDNDGLKQCDTTLVNIYENESEIPDDKVKDEEDDKPLYFPWFTILLAVILSLIIVLIVIYSRNKLSKIIKKPEIPESYDDIDAKVDHFLSKHKKKNKK